MTSDIDAVQQVMSSLSDEARQLLVEILQLERERLHETSARASDLTEDILSRVKGLIP